ncbi:MAG: protease pro-enzyme activation domain-containing protein [Allosphingosinicella sp.]
MDETKILPGSQPRNLSSLTVASQVDPAERIEVSIYLKPRDGDAGIRLARPRALVKESREATHAADIEALRAFAESAGLQVTREDPARRLVRIAGPADKVQEAFGTTLHEVEQDGEMFRARSSSLSLPADIADRVLAVLGLDTRPIATPKLVLHTSVAAPAGFRPNEVAALYDFPQEDASGACIAIIELGGGYRDSDNDLAFEAMGLAVPPIVAVPVNGVQNQPGLSNADGEVALDIQVCGGAAPGARLAVYFARNSTQGFVDAITKAIHDDANRPSVVSISWGSFEGNWSEQGIRAMGAAFEDAASLRVTVLAASGDDLATDGADDGALHVDYPSSDPAVLGCGGTRISTGGGRISSETVWNRNGRGTGGGFSSIFPMPRYQSEAGVAALPGGAAMRGVPDVAGDADPGTGYTIILDGDEQVIGGTSAVAPLWAGLFALINAGRPAGTVGFVHDILYGADAAAFRDVTVGDNKVGGLGYDARAGWDPCTGLGSPVGTGVAACFQAPVDGVAAAAEPVAVEA